MTFWPKITAYHEMSFKGVMYYRYYKLIYKTVSIESYQANRASLGFNSNVEFWTAPEDE